MPKLAFSKRRLEELGAPARGRADYHDTKAPGLCLTVTEKGTKTFSLYRRVDGQPARIKIGRFPETSVEQARKQAVELNAALARGEDPALGDADALGVVGPFYRVADLAGALVGTDEPKVRRVLPSLLGALELAPDLVRERAGGGQADPAHLGLDLRWLRRVRAAAHA